MDVMRAMYSIALPAMTVAASIEPGKGCAENQSDAAHGLGAPISIALFPRLNRPLIDEATGPRLRPPSRPRRFPHRGGNCRKMRPVAPVAQMDRVAASEAAGRWFESNRARHLKQELTGTGPGQVTAPRWRVSPISAMQNRSGRAPRERTGRLSGCGPRS